MEDVADSERYREAVARLKKLLYDSPPPPPHTQPSSPLQHHARESRFEEGSGGAWRWLLGLLRHQEELITQLEKENTFLKSEVVSVGEGIQKLGQENCNLNRRLADALSQAIASEDAQSENGLEPDLTNSSLVALTRENQVLRDEVSRLDAALSAMSSREQEALVKLSSALCLAQDTHSHTAQVRASSESAVEELTLQLTEAKQEAQDLRARLDDSEVALRRHQDQHNTLSTQQQHTISTLKSSREELQDEVERLQRENESEGRRLRELEEELDSAKSGKSRLEGLLEEQRQRSDDAHTRLHTTLLARDEEVALAKSRAGELEDRLKVARQDNTRLLETLTSLLHQGGSRATEGSTDDVKRERLEAGQQLCDILGALNARHEGEVADLREVASDAVEGLRKEVEALRQQLLRDNQEYRARLEDVTRGLAALSPTPPTPLTDSVINDPTTTAAAITSPRNTATSSPTMTDSTTVAPNRATSANITTPATSRSPETTTTSYSGMDPITTATVNDDITMEEENNKVAPDRDVGKETDKEDDDEHNERDENEEVEVTDNDTVKYMEEDEHKAIERNDHETEHDQAKEIEPDWGERREEENKMSVTPLTPKEKQDTNTEEKKEEHKNDNNTDKEKHEVESNKEKDMEPSEEKQHSSITDEKEKHEVEDKEKDMETGEEKQPLDITHEKHEIEGKEKDMETDEEKPNDSREGESEMELDPSRTHSEVPDNSMISDSGNDMESSEHHVGKATSDSAGHTRDETVDSEGEPEKISDSAPIEISDAGDKAGEKYSESNDTAENKGSDSNDKAENKGSDSQSNGEEDKITEPECAKCTALTHVLRVVGSAVDDLDADLGKQETRVNRLIQRTTQECDNCIKYQVILWTLYSRLDNVDKYTHLLGDKIDDLSRRVVSL